MLVVEAEYEGKSPKKEFPLPPRSDQFGTRRNTKSVQEVSKHFNRSAGLRGHYGKTDIRYWLEAVFRQKYTRNGVAHQVSAWAIKIQHVGRRETFPLGTANRTAAAAKAKDIYLNLQADGWEATLAKFKPKANAQCPTATTVGEFLEQTIVIGGGRSKTIEGYCRAFRTIVSSIFKIDGGSGKFDYRRGGGREKWIAKVHSVRLSDVTPDKIQKWKVAFLQRAATDPLKLRAARISVNSLMRQAKSLFTADRLKFIRLNIQGTPFDDVRFEPRQSMRYRSSFDVEQVIRAAQDELPQEQLKIFLLAVMAGLRRNEIDKLEWSSFRWTQNVIRIEATQYLQPKSEDSIGDVEVDPELMEIFRAYNASTKGAFVIESDVAPRMRATYSHYRCARDFTALTTWLRAHGVTSNRPLHSLRKEYGSQVCAKHGIYAASQALRHADITITSQHYLDRRKRSTVGLGNLLGVASNIVAIAARRGLNSGSITRAPLRKRLKRNDGASS
jgi:Phage integrase family.